MRYLAPLLTMLLLASACTQGGTEAASLAVVPVVPDVDEPTPTPPAVPTTEPVALPTATAVPVPTATPTPAPTAIPTAVPEPTPIPTAIAEPTVVPAPVATVAPTAVPEPTPVPTATPEPTPEPTATPEPTPEPEGAGGPPATHRVAELGYLVFGQAGGLTLRMPAARIELVGYHEASHPGAQGMNLAATGLPSLVLDSRGRGTDARSAADIVVPPGEVLRAPVTGTIVSSQTYVLYCEHQDQLVYIEPDGLPGWQVRLFHVAGETPAVGTRVIAGETIVATGGANPLPFESQVDEFTAEPSWPHTHLEIVDTSVPDDRPPGGGCP